MIKTWYQCTVGSKTFGFSIVEGLIHDFPFDIANGIVCNGMSTNKSSVRNWFTRSGTSVYRIAEQIIY